MSPGTTQASNCSSVTSPLATAASRRVRPSLCAFLAMAAALGAGSGATFALIARVTDPSRVGGVTGLVGAAGGLGGFAPPLVMGYIYGRTNSYVIGLVLLSVAAAVTLVLTVTIVRSTAKNASRQLSPAAQR